MRSTGEWFPPGATFDPDRTDRALLAEAKSWLEFWGADTSEDLKLIARLAAALARRVE